MREVKSRQLIASVKKIMEGRSVSMGVEDDIQNRIILPTLVCTRDMEMKCSATIMNTCGRNKLHM